MKPPRPPLQDFVNAIQSEMECLRRIRAIIQHTKFNNPPGVEQFRTQQHREATKRLMAERKTFTTHHC
jgi:hypothetical protein